MPRGGTFPRNVPICRTVRTDACQESETEPFDGHDRPPSVRAAGLLVPSARLAGQNSPRCIGVEVSRLAEGPWSTMSPRRPASLPRLLHSATAVRCGRTRSVGLRSQESGRRRSAVGCLVRRKDPTTLFVPSHLVFKGPLEIHADAIEKEEQVDSDISDLIAYVASSIARHHVVRLLRCEPLEDLEQLGGFDAQRGREFFGLWN